MKGTSGPETVSTKLQRIAELARQAPTMVFTTLAHHIHKDFLREAYQRTRKDGAAGRRCDECTSRKERARKPGRSASRFRPQTAATFKRVPWETVTITLPIHPLIGRELAVERLKRQGGRQYVMVEHPDGSRVGVPLDWTDRWPSARGESAARLDAQGLKQAGAAVADWRGRLCEKLDEGDRRMTLARGGSDGGVPVASALKREASQGVGSLGALGSSSARRSRHRGGSSCR